MIGYLNAGTKDKPDHIFLNDFDDIEHDLPDDIFYELGEHDQLII